MNRSVITAIQNVVIAVCVISLIMGVYMQIAPADSVTANAPSSLPSEVPYEENNNGDGNIFDGTLELPDFDPNESIPPLTPNLPEEPSDTSESSSSSSTVQTSTPPETSKEPSSSSSKPSSTSPPSTSTPPSSSSKPSSTTPPSSSSKPSSTTPPSTSTPSSEEPEKKVDEILRVEINGDPVEMRASELLPQIVANEIGSTWEIEAIKAQAVAAHTFIKYNNLQGKAPVVYVKTPDSAGRIKNAVMEVVDKVITYKGSPIYAPYFASSAGKTNSSADVWGGSYPYLIGAESKYDYQATGYKGTVTYTEAQLKSAIEAKVDVELTGDPSQWIKILTRTTGDYVGNVSICGVTTYYNSLLNKSTKITGRWIREDILKLSGKNLRSASFDIEYKDGVFTFTTYGYGHGCGLSQWGAQLYAKNEGWKYDQILTHYYKGTTITTLK